MSDRVFLPLEPGYGFARLEQDVLAKWQRERTFERTLERPAPRGEWVFYEGPPTANNVPHVGHVVTRVVKDLFPRFRTMQGYRVARKAGWDTHGLAVEIEVEKRLGFSGKQQIEEFGIAEFNRACLESVGTYEEKWRVMTERVGYWTDLDDPYVTYSNRYIESVWWALAELWRRGFLSEGYKIQPCCGRCGTTLSSHEVAQNYREVEDPSVWVLFPARSGQQVRTTDGQTLAVGPDLALVAWTTTPWTLLAHVALAVHPDLEYRVVQHPVDASRRVLFGDDLETAVPLVVHQGGKLAQLDLRELPPLARVKGRELLGIHYERPFRFFPVPDGLDEGDAPWRVIAGDYVTASDGTGLVHTAPPFGEDDYRSGRQEDLPFYRSVDSDGRIVAEVEPWAGQWFKDADPEIQQDLKSRGLLLHAARYRHSYPFCWRCDRPLLYYATESWFVTTTAAKDRLVELNQQIDWRPEHIRDGRFGNWLDNVVDWALSRHRYWGTPLPIWRCDGCSEVRVIGGYQELFEASGRRAPDDFYDQQQFDPHRPFIDDFCWSCTRCEGGTMRRVEEVIDAWFDSGAMPFAQHHFPFENRERFAAQFPADLISEAVDQTRGWFYTLHVLGTLLFDSMAFRACIVLGHVNDEEGRKMSKRLGNVVEPMQVMEETGADALRWYFYISNPELSSRFSARLVREAAQRFLLPIWNAVSFLTIYANLDSWRPGEPSVRFEDRPPLDRWVLLRLDRLVEEVTGSLDSYRVADAARALEEFVEQLTNWYIRRSRDRFWASAGDQEAGKESAYQSLYEVLTTLTRLLAPFLPFLAETLHERLVRSQDPTAPESVHLENWPVAGGRSDEALEAGVAAVQRIVSLGHAARQSHSLKTRQPLSKVVLVSADRSLPEQVRGYEQLLLDELNVRELVWANDPTAYVHHQVRPVFPRLGPRFGRRMPAVKAALEGADGDRLAQQLGSEGRLRIELDGEELWLERSDVEVELIEHPGLATQADGSLLLALDTEITDELRAEGWAREVVHRIQTARKTADLDYADRVQVHIRAEDSLASAIRTHEPWIRGETLAVDLILESPTGPVDEPIDGMAFALQLERVQ